MKCAEQGAGRAPIDALRLGGTFPACYRITAAQPRAIRHSIIQEFVIPSSFDISHSSFNIRCVCRVAALLN
jgi:hypothetical protein